MDQPEDALYLHEEIMLLALRDDKGTVEFGSMYGYALGGALLAELLLAGRISVDPGKKKLVNLVSDEPMEEPVIDDCLRKVADARRRAKTETWVSRFASLKHLHHRIARGLCERGILKATEDKVLLIFPRTIYPEIDPQPEQAMIERLREAIFTDDTEVDPRTAILVSLADGADLLKTPFDKKALKRRKERIRRLTSGELMGAATREAVEAAQTAAAIACIMPAMMVTTTSS